MKRLFRTLVVALMALVAVSTPVFFVTSCEDKPIEVIVTDYKYTISMDDIHMAEGVYPECVIRLSSGGAVEESVKVNYKIDDDLSLRIKINGQEVKPGETVTFDVSGQLVLTLPALAEGHHVLHLVITNQYGKSAENDIGFNVIRDKVYAKELKVPERLYLEVGSQKDTALSVVPENADITKVAVSSSDSSVAVASVLGEGADKTLRVDTKAEGTARIMLRHEDISKEYVIPVEGFRYKIGGLTDFTIEEGKEVSLTLTVEPENSVTLTASNSNVAIKDLGGKTFRISAVTPGSSILRAKSGNTTLEAVATVAKKEETVAVSPMSATIGYGATKMFSVSSSADFRVDLSADDATISETTSSSVTLKNTNRKFTDTDITMTVINRADENKKAVASIKLERKPETITLTESASEPGRCYLAVGGENAGWEVESVPNGIKTMVADDELLLVNDTYRSITGKVSVKTRQQGVSTSKNVTVPGLDVTLQSLVLDPETFTVEVGRTVSMSVIGKYVDGTQKDVTSEVTWTQSQNLQRSSNNFQGVDPGEAWIKASIDGIYRQATGRVTMTVTDLAIEPTYFNALVGDSRLFTVTAKYSNGSTKDVTRECTYNIKGGAKEAAKGYITMTEPGEVIVEVFYIYDGKEYSAMARGSVTKPQGTVVRVGIDPVTASCKVGESVTFKGTVYYSDGTQDNTSGSWSVSDTKILTGGGGTYVGIAGGTAQVIYACGQYSAPATVTVTGGGDHGGDFDHLSVSRSSLEMQVGGVEAVSAIAHYTDGSAKDVTREAKWSSTNEAIVSVDGYGYVSARAAGSAIVTAEWGGGTARVSVNVKGAMSSLRISPSSLSLSEGGQSSRLSVTAVYSDGTEEDVTGSAQWSSSNAAVATVSGGTVTPVGQGSCTITAKYSGKNATCSVTVGPAEVDHIELFSAAYLNYTCTVGDEYGLNAIAYIKGSGKTVGVTNDATWTCSPAGGVSFSYGSNNKRIRALKAGDYTITVTYGGKSANAYVHIKEKEGKINGITLSPSSVTLSPGGTYDLSNVTCRYTMDNGTTGSVVDASKVSWSKVSGSGVSLSGKTVRVDQNASAGTTTLKATSDGYSANFTVSVPMSIRIDTPSTLFVQVNTEKALSPSNVKVTAVYENGSTTDITSSSDLKWESLNSSVASIRKNSSDGWYYVKGVKGNSSTSVRATYKAYTADLPVSVTGDGTVPVTGVLLNKEKLSLTVGGSETLSATVQPSDATNKGVTWESSNTSVATVSEGTVTAKGVGSCSITVKTKDGGHTASCSVSVTAASVGIQSIDVYEVTSSGEKKITGTLKITVGKDTKLRVKPTPSDATIDNVTWNTKSSNDIAVYGDSNPFDATLTCSKNVAESNTVVVSVTDYNNKKVEKEVSVVSEMVSKAITIDGNLKQVEWTDGQAGSGAAKTFIVYGENVSGIKATVTGASSHFSTVSISNDGTSGSRTTFKVSVYPNTTNTSEDEITAKVQFTATDDINVKSPEVSLVHAGVPPTVKAVSVSASPTKFKGAEAGYSELSAKAYSDMDMTKEMTDVSFSFVQNQYDALRLSISGNKVTCSTNPENDTQVQVKAVCNNVSSDYITLTVEHNKESYGLALSLSAWEGEIDDNVTITATGNKPLGNVSWTVDPSGIVDLAPNDKAKSCEVTAKKVGNCKITAKCGDDEKTCTVTVREKTIQVTSISCDKPELELTDQETHIVNVYVYPYNANTGVDHVGYNTNNVSVQNNRDYTAKIYDKNVRILEYYVKWENKNAFGTETITFKSNVDESKYCTCKVTYKSGHNVPVINFTGTTTYNAKPSNSFTLTSTGLKPETGSLISNNKEFNFTTKDCTLKRSYYEDVLLTVDIRSSNESVATVAFVNGAWTVTAHNTGTAELTVTLTDPGNNILTVSGKITVIVSPQEDPGSVKSVYLKNTVDQIIRMTTLDIGETQTFYFKGQRNDGTEFAITDFDLSVSNSSAVSATKGSSPGEVVLRGLGRDKSVTVTATHTMSSKKATLSVQAGPQENVTDLVSDISGQYIYIIASLTEVKTGNSRMENVTKDVSVNYSGSKLTFNKTTYGGDNALKVTASSNVTNELFYVNYEGYQLTFSVTKNSSGLTIIETNQKQIEH